MKFILGTKQHMTEYFAEDGTVHAATVVAAGPLTVTQTKTMETDGYDAVQVGYGARKEKNLSKAVKGHLKDTGSFMTLKEFRMHPGEMKKGDQVTLDTFAVGDVLTVTGTTKAKGYQGVVKRHNFSGGPRSHGQKHTERGSGSIGSTGPQRVFKGTRMGGRMGGDTVSVKNLKVLALDPEKNTMLISGAVPGRRGTVLEIISK